MPRGIEYLNFNLFVMGCDIHLFCETKDSETGQWILCSGDDSLDAEDKFDGRRFYTDGRNYNLFAALGGIRINRFNDAPKPIAKDRGFPIDCCQFILDAKASWGSDWHSHSWASLQDLKEYDWTPWGNTCNSFIGEVIPKMECFNTRFVRIVFAFDN